MVEWSNKGRDETEASQLSALLIVRSDDNGRCTAHKTKWGWGESGESFKSRRLNGRIARCERASERACEMCDVEGWWSRSLRGEAQSGKP